MSTDIPAEVLNRTDGLLSSLAKVSFGYPDGPADWTAEDIQQLLASADRLSPEAYQVAERARHGLIEVQKMVQYQRGSLTPIARNQRDSYTEYYHFALSALLSLKQIAEQPVAPPKDDMIRQFRDWLGRFLGT